MPIPFNPPEPVYPTWGQSLGQGLLQGVSGGVAAYQKQREMDQQAAMLQMQMMKYQRELQSDALSDQLKQSQIGINQKILNQPGSQMPDIVNDPDTGLGFVRTDTRQGPRFQALPGQMPSEMERTRRGQIEDAKKALDVVEQIIDSPSGRSAIMKAGGDYRRLASLADPIAQKLAYEVFTAADARARILTGAQMNEQELDRYYNGLMSRFDEPEAIKYKIKRQKEFYDSIFKQYTQFGSRINQSGVGGAGDLGRAGDGMDTNTKLRSAAADLYKKKFGGKK